MFQDSCKELPEASPLFKSSMTPSTSEARMASAFPRVETVKATGLKSHKHAARVQAVDDQPSPRNIQ